MTVLSDSATTDLKIWNRCSGGLTFKLCLRSSLLRRPHSKTPKRTGAGDGGASFTEAAPPIVLRSLSPKLWREERKAPARSLSAPGTDIHLMHPP